MQENTAPVGSWVFCEVLQSKSTGFGRQCQDGAEHDGAESGHLQKPSGEFLQVWTGFFQF
ncbi:hypothetical protein GCM10008938_48980 [Deinococcus roseus]|uniref:Uncharacterized protein n=1 Tax=Deinococcus roseus TaxID=392414 RepID=A0ABQ2DGE2_9DEIO|nr:hypothetical protein GCM10008938_48980 [Deinococcus roseus]